MAFGVWFLSLGIMFVGFVHVVAWTGTSCLFVAEKYSIVCIPYDVFIHSSMGGLSQKDSSTEYFYTEVSRIRGACVGASSLCPQRGPRVH